MPTIDDVKRALDLLGLDETATPEAIAARRREIAGHAHPDRGGTHEEMSVVNRAIDLLLQWRLDPSRFVGSRRDGDSVTNATGATKTTGATGATEPGRHAGLRVDRPSFVVEALPVVAHEALLLAAGVLGRVCDDDPPYVIETSISVDESTPGLVAFDRTEVWCRLELVPDAGSTTVSIIADIDPELLVGLWCDAVNELGLPD